MSDCKRQRLYQLPNGDWCDPTTIVSVRALGETDPEMERIMKFHHSPRVVVGHSGGCLSIREYDTFEHACEVRDRIANDVNAALKGTPP